MQQIKLDCKPVLQALGQFYTDIDHQVFRLVQAHSKRIKCRKGCSGCCIDDITVFEVEAQNIRHYYGTLLENVAPHDMGTCAFLDAHDACRIYKHRPYVCRTQGLPLHWIEERENGSMVAMRDICPINDPGTPVEELPEEQCWKIGPFEEQLARLQLSIDKGEMRRVKLRDLFFSAPRVP